MSKWTRSEIEDIRALLNDAIDDVDAGIIDAIRRNEGANPYYNGANGTPPSRETLLSQLDVLEKVRERLNVRYDNQHFDQ
ncbi:hypothetical protein D3C80_1717890 [compost metagenome]